MYPITGTIGWNYGFIALWGLHIFSVVAFFTGVLFLIVLAIKTFTPVQLKNWAIWLMIIGTVVCLVTIAIIGRPWIGLTYWGAGMQGMQMMRMNQMMEMMMEHDQRASGKENEEHGNMMQMMRGMMNTGGSMQKENEMMPRFGDDSDDLLQDEHHESSSSSR